MSNDERLKYVRRVISREPVSLNSLSSAFNLNEREVRDILEELQVRGHNIDYITDSNGDVYVYLAERVRNGREVVINTPRNVRFGVVSDTHFGNKKDMLLELRDFYNKLRDEGVLFVLHCGDVIDGMNIYRGQIYDLKPEAIGIEAQIKYLEENYPYIEGVKTYFIRGNHDVDKYNRDINPFSLMNREDLIYIGDDYKEIILRDLEGREIKIALVHSSGGGAYAISYKAQQYLRGKNPRERADMYIFGHWHKAGIFWYESNLLVMAGCMQRDTDYIVRKGLQGDQVAWFFKLRYGEDRAIEQVEPKIFAY